MVTKKQTKAKSANPREFKLKYSGRPHSIDALAFVNSLMGITAVIETISYQEDPARKVNIRIKALDKGSFIIHLELVESLVKTLLSPEGMGYASAMIGTVVGVYELRKHLQGKKEKSAEPVSGNSVKVTNCKGSVTYVDNRVYHMHNLPPVKQGVDQTFSALQDSPDISGFDFMDANDKPLFTAKRKEFTSMVMDNEPAEKVEDMEPRVVTRNDILSIIKPSFDSNLKWEVIASSLQQRISVRNSDPEFLRRVQMREEIFAAGDILEVEMDVSQVWNSTAMAYESKAYSIAKVLRHEKGATQIPLDIE